MSKQFCGLLKHSLSNKRLCFYIILSYRGQYATVIASLPPDNASVPSVDHILMILSRKEDIGYTYMGRMISRIARNTTIALPRYYTT